MSGLSSQAAAYHPRPYARPVVWGMALGGAVLLGLWLLGTQDGVLGRADAIGYAICHRIAERSFHAHDRPLPLCARCTGIYLGVIIGLLLILARGRGRAGQLPPVRVLVVLLGLAALYALDGLNSYLSLFLFYTPLYQPHNTLRLLTGLTFGLALISLALPLFNAIVWRAPRPAAAIASLRELALLYAAAALTAGVMLLNSGPLRIVLGLVSVTGVVLMFALIGSVAFLTLARRENSIAHPRQLIVPVAAGLVFALAVIGAIDLVRYLLTGTWDGFEF